MKNKLSSRRFKLPVTNNKWSGLLFLGALFIGFTACEENEEPPADSVSEGDKNFVVQASYANLAEVAMAQWAISEGSDPAIREFAETLVTDHTNAQDELRYIAESYELAIPDTLNNEQQEIYNGLSELQGYSLDSAYINNQIISHQQSQQIYQDQIDQGENSRVAEYASTTLPHINEHLARAITLKEGLVPQE